MLFFLLISVHLLTAWEHELTTDIIQKYTAPNTLLREFAQVHPTIVKRYYNYYVKKACSRIIGVERLNAEFVASGYSDFKTPEKFLIPFFDRKGTIDLNKSFILAAHVEADYLYTLSDLVVERLLNIAENTEIWDFAQRNILQDTDGNIWFIDTEVWYKSNYAAAAAESLLDSHKDLLMNGYSLSAKSQKKLLSYVSSPISKRRFKDLHLEDLQSSDYE